MAGIRQHATTPELAVRRALRAIGRRYRFSNSDLPGTPDLTNRAERWAILVHGCFWHRHTGCRRTTTPKQNRTAWEEKFAANVSRDRRKAAELRRRGYAVLTIWECETEDDARLQERLQVKFRMVDRRREAKK